MSKPMRTINDVTSNWIGSLNKLNSSNTPSTNLKAKTTLDEHMLNNIPPVAAHNIVEMNGNNFISPSNVITISQTPQLYFIIILFYYPIIIMRLAYIPHLIFATSLKKHYAIWGSEAATKQQKRTAWEQLTEDLTQNIGEEVTITIAKNKLRSIRKMLRKHEKTLTNHRSALWMYKFLAKEMGLMNTYRKLKAQKKRDERNIRLPNDEVISISSEDAEDCPTPNYDAESVSGLSVSSDFLGYDAQLERPIELARPIGLEIPTELEHLRELESPMELERPIKLENFIALENPIVLELPAKLENPTELERPRALENSIELGSPIKLENTIELEGPRELESLIELERPIKLESPLELESSRELENPIELEHSRELENPIELERPIKLESPIELERPRELESPASQELDILKKEIARLRKECEALKEENARLKKQEEARQSEK
uniref:MADF domain-containing protein n=1 Tax=Glossina pallidipes TaxID=7398 RepID=A0A1A9ZRE6_GLOPL